MALPFTQHLLTTDGRVGVGDRSIRGQKQCSLGDGGGEREQTGDRSKGRLLVRLSVDSTFFFLSAWLPSALSARGFH